MADTQTTINVGSAFVGALAVLILRSLLKLVGDLLARLKPRANYDCAVPGTQTGELRHCLGHVVDDKESTSGKAWQHDWIRTDPTSPSWEHTIYGPYVNDFGKPGCYRVVFRICGKNFPKTPEPVLSLDVVEASFGTVNTLRLLGQRIIRANELTGSYQNFEIVCYAPGTNVYEYRCAVIRNKLTEIPPNEGNTPLSPPILFDCVKVYSYRSIWEII